MTPTIIDARNSQRNLSQGDAVVLAVRKGGRLRTMYSCITDFKGVAQDGLIGCSEVKAVQCRLRETSHRDPKQWFSTLGARDAISNMHVSGAHWHVPRRFLGGDAPPNNGAKLAPHVHSIRDSLCDLDHNSADQALGRHSDLCTERAFAWASVKRMKLAKPQAVYT